MPLPTRRLGNSQVAVIGFGTMGISWSVFSMEVIDIKHIKCGEVRLWVTGQLPHLVVSVMLLVLILNV